MWETSEEDKLSTGGHTIEKYIPMLDLRAQYASIREEIRSAVDVNYPENKWNISLQRFSAARLASFKDAVENLHRGWPFVRCLHLLARGVGDIPS